MLQWKMEMTCVDYRLIPHCENLGSATFLYNKFKFIIIFLLLQPINRKIFTTSVDECKDKDNGQLMMPMFLWIILQFLMK